MAGPGSPPSGVVRIIAPSRPDAVPAHPPGAWTRQSLARLAALGATGVEHARALDDLAHQAVADALLAIMRELGQFQGRSRSTTWAYGFAVLEVASELRRHWWQQRTTRLDAGTGEGRPDRSSPDPIRAVQWRDLVSALHDAVDTALTPRQRTVFVAVVLDDVPLEDVVTQTGSNRNALYETLFDVRRELRAHLDAAGHLEPSAT